jgi:hypothetical protein
MKKVPEKEMQELPKEERTMTEPKEELKLTNLYHGCGTFFLLITFHSHESS